MHHFWKIQCSACSECNVCGECSVCSECTVCSVCSEGSQCSVRSAFSYSFFTFLLRILKKWGVPSTLFACCFIIKFLLRIQKSEEGAPKTNFLLMLYHLLIKNSKGRRGPSTLCSYCESYFFVWNVWSVCSACIMCSVCSMCSVRSVCSMCNVCNEFAYWTTLTAHNALNFIKDQ